MKRILTKTICLALAAIAAPAMAGTFASITIDGDYSDWASIPALDDDSGDNASGPDIGITKIANDGDYLYIYNTFPNGTEISTFTSIDFDSDSATGFDVFGLGLIGAEAAWQNDFPFTQDALNFNNGSGMSGDFFGSGAALLDDFANGTERELAISLDIVFNAGGNVFDDDDFDILFWTDTGVGADGIPSGFPGDAGLNGDVSAAISYSLAEVPEPVSLSLLATSLLGLSMMRRR